MKMDCRSAFLAIAIFVVPPVSVAAEYKLGPEDKVRVMVYEWRPSRGETYAWAPLNAEFTVSPGGGLSLPLIGEIVAQSMTPTQVGNEIAELLQKKMGLVSRPSASVEVARYRPFYVSGEVATPGEYPFRPELTVAKALALAGGLYRLSSVNAAGFIKDATATRGDQQVMTNELDALIAKRARLKAEAGDLSAVDFPKSKTDGRESSQQSQAIQQEQSIFVLRRSSLKSRIDSFSQEKQLLGQEVTALSNKDANLERQLTLASAERDSVKILAEKGLAITNRQLAVEQAVAQLESNRIDIRVARFKAEQDKAKVDRDIAALEDQRRSEIFLELRQVEDRISQLAIKINTAQTLIEQAQAMGAQQLALADEGREVVPEVFIMRKTDSGAAEFRADISTAVQPGDVIRVAIPSEYRLRRMPQSSQNATSSNDGARQQSSIK